MVHYALRTGYRHVDSAVAYHNEAPSLAGMRSASLPRSSLFFTSKVPPKAMSYSAASQCIAETLEKIDAEGFEYIDLYLLHCPYGGREARIGAWRALVDAAASGRVRSIGVSNYGVHHLEELEAWQKGAEQTAKGSGGVLSVNQVELHPWLARPDIVEWCRRRGVILEAYCPLVRAERMQEPVLKELATKHQSTPAQILVRWSLQMGFVPLPKSVTDARIEENADVYSFELDRGDMEKLNTGAYAPCSWDPTVSRD